MPALTSILRAISLAGPQWIYLSTLPRSVLRAQAFESTRWVLWSALASLALELVLLGLILRQSIARPVGQLVGGHAKTCPRWRGTSDPGL